MRAELSFLQKALKLLLIITMTTTICVVVFNYVPVNGVRSDVIVLFPQQPDGSFARDITANATIIAESSLRERANNGEQLSTTYINIVEQGKGGQTFSLSTYGKDEARNLARENRTALNQILLEIRKHYGSTFPAFFDVVGNTYEAMRWQYALITGLVSLLLSAIIMKMLQFFLVKDSQDEIQEESQEQEFQEWYKDKHVLDQINASRNGQNVHKAPHEKTPMPEQSAQQVHAQHSAQTDFSPNQPNKVKSVVWSPTNRTTQSKQDTKKSQLSAQDVSPKNGKGDMAQEDKRSRLAEKWGKGSAADRLRALEDSQENNITTKSAPEESQETFSLSSLPRSNAQVIETTTKKIKNQDLKETPQSSLASPQKFSLPHQRHQAVVNTQEMSDKFVEEQKSGSQGDEVSDTQDPETTTQNQEQYFTPGGSLSRDATDNHISDHSDSNTALAPGNLPVVDVSSFEQNSTQNNHGQTELVQNIKHQTVEDTQQDLEDVDFYSEDANVLIDSQEMTQEQRSVQNIAEQTIKEGEPTNQELKERLNKLLRGEL